MSEVKRTKEDIHKDYQRACFQAGHIQFQVFTLQKDLEMLNAHLRDLNNEAGALNVEEAKAAAAATPAAQPSEAPATPAVEP